MIRNLLVTALALLAGCSSLKTSIDYDTEADFSGLVDYAWIDASDGSLTMQRVRKAVDEALAARGFHVDPASPDFLVSAWAGSEERVEVTDRGYSYGRWGGGVPAPGVDVYRYQEGTLVLDAIDAGARTLIWRGTATKVVDPDATPEEREQGIREAVEALLERFPPEK